jgi:predicted AlkP superfamily pyrophosphatase or phosphodiesterase
VTTDPKRLVWIDVVGLTPRLLAHAPNLRALGAGGFAGPLRGVTPAVTLTAQASALTGTTPDRHGVVGNGWFHRDTGEVRFWLQGHALIQAETLYATLVARGERPGAVLSASVFGWFAQGAPLSASVFPKPYYGSDGGKAFAIHGVPDDVPAALERSLGAFPFASFWGPRAGLPSTTWIARAAATLLRERRPTFAFVYLPHLDYDLQRFGPDDPRVPARVAEADAAAATVIEAARAIGAEVVAFSEYGIAPVSRAETPNRALREAGLLAVRDGPYGETIETFESRAFAVCDHQVAHVHAKTPADLARAKAVLAALPGVERALEGRERAEVGLDHPRAGDLVLLAESDAWFAYPYWLDDARAPDFARTVDIHRKPGYDPCELFVDPGIAFPRLRVARRLARKKLGFRYRMDVVPLDPSLVRGSHGVAPKDPLDGAVVVAGSRAAGEPSALVDLRAHALRTLGLPA